MQILSTLLYALSPSFLWGKAAKTEPPDEAAPSNLWKAMVDSTLAESPELSEKLPPRERKLVISYLYEGFPRFFKFCHLMSNRHILEAEIYEKYQSPEFQTSLQKVEDCFRRIQNETAQYMNIYFFLTVLSHLEEKTFVNIPHEDPKEMLEIFQKIINSHQQQLFIPCQEVWKEVNDLCTKRIFGYIREDICLEVIKETMPSWDTLVDFASEQTIEENIAKGEWMERITFKEDLLSMSGPDLLVLFNKHKLIPKTEKLTTQANAEMAKVKQYGQELYDCIKQSEAVKLLGNIEASKMHKQIRNLYQQQMEQTTTTSTTSIKGN